MNHSSHRPAARRDGRARARPSAAPQLGLIAPSASPEEAAAIAAALERFMRATAPAAVRAEAPDRWRRAAMLEGLRREDAWDASDPWINT
jgi:hypothetical protein